MYRGEIIVVVLLVFLTLAACGSNPAPVEKKVTVTGEKPEMDALEGFPEVSLTIYPIAYTITGPTKKYKQFYDRMMGPAGEKYFDVVDTLGLLLEEKGYDNFVIAETKFRFPEGKDKRKDRSRMFADFVKEMDLKTDYAMCTELTLNLEKSFQEVYTVIVDKSGDVVWERSWKRDDPEFENSFPGTPEKCYIFVCNRLAQALNLDELPEKELDADKKEALRKMRESDPPDKSQFAAMEKRREAMKKIGESAKVTVCPVRVNGEKAEQTLTSHLYELLNEEKICQATVGGDFLDFETDGWPNEQKVLWQYAWAAKHFVEDNPPDTDYILFADYWQRPDDKAIHAVHFVLCDRNGDWVIVDFQNSHQKAFKRTKPGNLEDCNTVVMKRLKDIIR